MAPADHDIAVRGLTHTYRGGTTALRDLDLDLPANRIVGLLGRNGAGKTTLLSCLAGHRKPTSGTITVGGTPVWETARMRDVFLITEGGGSNDTGRLAARVELISRLRPNFDRAYAFDLLAVFDLDPRSKVHKLSKGQRAAAGVSIALAARAPITMLDEAHLGMDAQNRYALYDALLADLVDQPRTVVLSTHHVDEIARLLSDIVILDEGRLLHHGAVADLVAGAARLTGPASRIAAATRDVTVLDDRTAGGARSTVVTGIDLAAMTSHGREHGIAVEAVGLQDLFVAMTTAPASAGTRDKAHA